MIKAEQLTKIKEILTELKATEKNCGACGQFFNAKEADKNGLHSFIWCDAADELDPVSEKLTNLINNTESYLQTESSKTHDDAGYRNHLRGEISGYKIALDLIKAAK